MKKIFIFFLIILGTFSLNGCKEKDKETIDPVKENRVLVIECEDDWKDAFKSLKFDRFSFDFTTDLSLYNNYSGLICDEGCYIKSKTSTQATYKTSHYDSEIYYKETYGNNGILYYELYQNIVSTHQYVEFGTYYMVNEQKDYPTLEEALKNRCWTKAFSEMEKKGYKEYVQKYIVDVTPFEEMFQKFNFNEKEKNYSYSGRIDCTFLNEEIGMEKQFSCIDPVITFKYNEIQSIHFKFERMGQIDRDNMGLITGEMNYYDFRTTRIPLDLVQAILDLSK